MKRIRRGTALVMAAFLALAAGQAQADPRSKWRIEFDHSSDSAGEIVLRITPENGQPIDVTTQIPDATRENVAADLVRDSLKAALGKGYKIQTDDGEAVLIRKSGKTPKFELTLASSTATGLSVKIERD
jgi:phosphomannomutase